MKDQDLVDGLEWLRVEENNKKNSAGKLELAVTKIKENPFLPVGVLATTGCLIFGLRAMKKGDAKMSQMMMRGRVLAQGATVAAMVIGFCVSAAAAERKKAENKET